MHCKGKVTHARTKEECVQKYHADATKKTVNYENQHDLVISAKLRTPVFFGMSCQLTISEHTQKKSLQCQTRSVH